MGRITKIALPSSGDEIHKVYEARAQNAIAGSDSDWRRDHLGASIIGHDCDRYLWLSFRWALNPSHPGKQLRLFERGTREESWIVEDLRAAGFPVEDRDPDTGEQFRVVWHGGHFGGGLDGIIKGLFEAPKSAHVLEVKTHNLKSFGKLQKDGVKRSKPQHYAQMQTYMRGRGLERAFYVAVCKDNDEIYTERVHLDREFADELIARARRIIEATEPPQRQPEPAYPPCLYTTSEGKEYPCQFLGLCFGCRVAEKNCRTCVSSTPELSGGWCCQHHGASLSPIEQRQGCSHHLTIPSILNLALLTFVWVPEGNEQIPAVA